MSAIARNLGIHFRTSQDDGRRPCGRASPTQMSAIAAVTNRQLPRLYRAYLVLGVMCYIAFFNWMYVRYLYQEFDYLGFGYDDPGLGYVIAGWVLAALRLC